MHGNRGCAKGAWMKPNQDYRRWVVVKIMVPFWVPIIIRHLLFKVPKKGP